MPAASGQGLPEFSGEPFPNRPATLAPPGRELPDLGDPSQSMLSPAEEKRLGERIMREIREDRSYSDDA
jgi:predicted Zn-dependent protease